MKEEPPEQPIYFDNAATSWPKPPEVLEGIISYANEIGANPGRGSYERSIEASRIIFDLREKLATLFNIVDSRRIVITLNATHAINMALKGYLKTGDHVIITSMEHNAVVRPLNNLVTNRGVTYTKVKANSSGVVDPDDMISAIRPETRLVVTVHASNVFGSLNDIGTIGKICNERGLTYLVDAAQTAGSSLIDVEQMHIDMLAFPGHKGLMGPTGTGGLYVSPDISLNPWVEGGTGTASENTTQPDYYPDFLEAGTGNMIGLAGLLNAVDFILSKTPEKIGDHKAKLSSYFNSLIEPINRIIRYTDMKVGNASGVVSINIDGIEPNIVGFKLEQMGNIMVRTGLHCSPLAHDTFGTKDTGTIRFSFGYYNTEEEIDNAVTILKNISKT